MGNRSTLDHEDLSELVDAVNANLGNTYQNKVIGETRGTAPRFELYHASPSLCSHKVRTVLAEKQLAYTSHDLNVMPAGKFVPHNYRPEYVKLRLQGAPDARLVSGYTGESSVTNQGFDPCVVPTLVDHQAARVVVDSNVICEYINAQIETGTDLIPTDLADDIKAQDELVDQAPHVAALYGAHPDKDTRPMGLKKNIAGVHAKKIRALNAMIDLVGDDGDPEVLAAYRAKIAKESAAGAFVADAQTMRETHQQMSKHVDALDQQLRSHSNGWVCGPSYTMADIMWTVSIWRMKWLGFGHLWEADAGRDRLNAYLERAFARPSFRAAVADWPGAHGPSPHIAKYRGVGAMGEFAAYMLRSTNWREVLWGDGKTRLPPARKQPA